MRHKIFRWPWKKKIVSVPKSVDDAREETHVEQGLKAVYLNAEGQVPNLALMDRVSRGRRLCVFGAGIFFMLCLGAGVWAGTRAWREQEKEGSGALSLTFVGAEEVALGEEQAYELVWRNTSEGGLYEAEVRLNLPTDFTVTSFDPNPTDPVLHGWKWMDVTKGQEERIRIKGFFVGSLGGQGALQALGSARKEAMSAPLQNTLLQKVRYTSTVLAGNLLFPERVVAGEPFQARYVIANLGKQSMGPLLARVQVPNGFISMNTATSVTIDPIDRRATFVLPILAPNTFYTAIFSGVFVSGMSGDVLFQGEVGRQGLEGSFLAATRNESRIALAPGDLTLRLVVNGEEVERSLEPHEPIRVALAYENTQRIALEDVQITLQVESIVNGKSATGTSLVDWKEMNDTLGGVSTTKTRIQTLVYDARRAPELREVAPGEQGSIEVSWPSLGVVSGTKDALIRFSAVARARIAGEKAPRLIRSSLVTLRYRSDIDLEIEPRYFTEEGAPLGSGPLPLIAGKTTTYRIYWRLAKTLHAMKAIQVSAAFSKIAGWTGKFEAPKGTMTYEEATRTVHWNIDQMPETMGELEGWFEIALTPEAVDIGRFAALLGETSFEGRDEMLEELITRIKPGLSTDLNRDEGAKGKGVVRKE